MMTPRDDDDQHAVDALLRAGHRPLEPPAGGWERVARRARRRRWRKAAAVACSGAAVVAGVLPAVILAGGHGNEQQVSISDSSMLPQTVTIDGDTASLRGFVARSVSFVTQTEGFAWGARSPDGAGVVAETVDSGATWHRIAAPPVAATAPDGAGDANIRFSNGRQGYVFGSSYYATEDGGQSWQQLPTPGHIEALETMNQRIWALVAGCQTCSPARLYTATPDDPRLQPVTSVPALRGRSVSLAADGSSVDVLVGAHDFWFTPDGRHWRRGVDPCDADTGNAIASWNLKDVVTACGTSHAVTMYESTDAGRHWSSRRTVAGTGAPLSVAAANGTDFVLATTRTSVATHNGARRWGVISPSRLSLGFVGFISPTDVVALPGPRTRSGAFLYSRDAGRTWVVSRFG